MKSQKQVFTKGQYALAFIPYLGLLITWVYSVYNVKKKKEDGYKYFFKLLGVYMVSMLLSAILFMGIFALLLKSSTALDSITVRIIMGLVGGYLICLISALCGVYAQAKILAEIQESENNAYLS